MSEPYDLRSNIKGKPGSQGTLFQVKDKSLLNPQQRWPQGYSPERLNEVRGALKATPISAPAHLGEPGDEENATKRMGYRDRFTRTVAKSAVPAEHLTGIREITGDPAPGDHGTYWFGQRKLQVNIDRPGSDRTVVHEIGHHVDNVHDTQSPHLFDPVAETHAVKDWTGHGAPNESAHYMAKSKVKQGVVEAVADNYYEEHYRTGGRKSQRVSGGLYEQNFEKDRLDKAYPGYSDVRPSNSAHMGPQFKQGELF